MSAQIWVLMQIIISIIFLHLCPRCQGNKAFPLSGSVRLQLVGILDSEPDGLAVLAAYVQQAVLRQACIRFLLIWSSQQCILIYLPDPTSPPLPQTPVSPMENLTKLCRCVQQEVSKRFPLDLSVLLLLNLYFNAPHKPPPFLSSCNKVCYKSKAISNYFYDSNSCCSWFLHRKLPFRCMNMLGSKTKETVLHGRANLFITTKLNFLLTALCFAILGVLFPVTYSSAGGGGEGMARRKCQ